MYLILAKSLGRGLYRLLWAILIGAALICIAIGVLWLADSYASNANTYCSVNLSKLQWLGCAMAAHEGLAAGLIGVAGALFAGWLAFDAVQEQIRAEARIEADRYGLQLVSLRACIYAEIADRAARCVNDCMANDDFSKRDRDAEWVRNLRPLRPVVLPAIAGSLGLLKTESLLAVSQFYSRLEAVTLAIDSTALAYETPDQLATHGNAAARNISRAKFIGTRLYSCLDPARHALRILAEPGAEIDAEIIDREVTKVYSSLKDSGLSLRAALEKYASKPLPL